MSTEFQNFEFVQYCKRPWSSCTKKQKSGPRWAFYGLKSNWMNYIEHLMVSGQVLEEEYKFEQFADWLLKGRGNSNIIQLHSQNLAHPRDGRSLQHLSKLNWQSLQTRWSFNENVLARKLRDDYTGPGRPKVTLQITWAARFFLLLVSCRKLVFKAAVLFLLLNFSSSSKFSGFFCAGRPVWWWFLSRENVLVFGYGRGSCYCER